MVDIAVVGAGPYGLGLAAYLAERGVEHRIFGRPMEAWRSMSAGMHLKSLGFATSIPTPGEFLSLPDYCRAHGQEDYEPIPIGTFADYGLRVQQGLVPHLEQTSVVRLACDRGAFELTLATGEVVRARRAVMALGLTCFERIPAPFDRLPPELVCHTAERGDFSGLTGLDVTVIGSGQSSLQAAALLHEHGAETRVVARGDVKWGGRGPRDHERSLFNRMKCPSTVLGHGRVNWVLEHLPWLTHALPDDRRLRFVHTHLGPGGAWWLRDRVEGVIPVRSNVRIVDAVPEGQKVRLTLVDPDGGTSDLVTEYVVLGTGYEIDVDAIPFVDRALAGRIRRIQRGPDLNRHFESSVPGLYFIGPSSALSFGPLFRFVAGARYAVPHVAAHLHRRATRRPNNH
jgi:cation diffusion facilitator CzcD-associated flavoprotein CzcO